MFVLVSKKKLEKKILEIQSRNKRNLTESTKNKSANAWRQGYEDGNDNMANTIKSFLKLHDRCWYEGDIEECLVGVVKKSE